jgi:hypothetical protein
MSLSPSPRQTTSRHPVSPPVAPRTPDGRRRPKVKSTLSSQSELYSLKTPSPSQSAESERLQAVKKLSSTEKIIGTIARSISPRTHSETSSKSRKVVNDTPSITFSSSVRTSKGTRQPNLGISSRRDTSAAAAAVPTSSGSSGVAQRQRSRILRDEDGDVYSPVVSDLFPTSHPSRMPMSIASTLSEQINDLNESDVFQASDIDIDAISSSR